MAFRNSWMVKGRFSSCLLWAWLKNFKPIFSYVFQHADSTQIDSFDV